MSLLVQRHELPRVPVEIADEVEVWARQYGRHASMHFIPTVFHNGRVVRGAWVVRLTLRSNDKRMILYQQGLAPEPPTEDIWLHVPNPRSGEVIPNTGGLKEPPYKGLDIYQLGSTGVRNFLEKGDTWSGRGEFKSMEQYAQKTMEDNQAQREKFRADQKEASRYEQRDKRRSRFKIPFLTVSLPWGRDRETTPTAPDMGRQERVT